MTTLDRVLEFFHLDPTGITEHKRSMPIEISNVTRTCLGDLFRALDFTEGAEIGVEQGVFSETLLNAHPTMTLHCVDAWQSHKAYRDHVSQEKLDEFYRSTQDRLAPYKAVLHRGFSVDVAQTFPNASLDFVYIDANHDLPHTIADMAAWTPKLRKGGILCGHDYIRRKTQSPRSSPHHVPEAVHAWTAAYHIYPWFVLGRRSPLEPDEIRERSRSWMWINE